MTSMNDFLLQPRREPLLAKPGESVMAWRRRFIEVMEPRFPNNTDFYLSRGFQHVRIKAKESWKTKSYAYLVSELGMIVGNTEDWCMGSSDYIWFTHESDAMQFKLTWEE